MKRRNFVTLAWQAALGFLAVSGSALAQRGGRGGGGRGGGRGGGGFEGVGSVASSAAAPTLRIHHAFVQLPDDDYVRREYDPRSSLGGSTYQDYSVPLGTTLTQRSIRRHRLERCPPV